MATQAAFMPGTATKAQGVLYSWLTTVDHKRIGILYGTSAFIFIAMILALMALFSAYILLPRP